MKYIDADKLIERLEEMKRAEYENCGGVNAKTGALYDVQNLIESLQQEQPGLPGIEESGIPGKDYIPVEWVDACEKYGKWKIVKQEQPEVDLDSEIIRYKVPFTDGSEYLNETTLDAIARHFYELGCSTQYQKDRGEFAKLKAKEWQDGYNEGYAKGLNARKGE